MIDIEDLDLVPVVRKSFDVLVEGKKSRGIQDVSSFWVFGTQ